MPKLRAVLSTVRSKYAAGSTRSKRALAYARGAPRQFGGVKPVPQYKIRTRPFYAAWATPLVHYTWAGLRINAQGQVMDMQGQVIPGLYCGGESAGGFNQHGLG